MKKEKMIEALSVRLPSFPPSPQPGESLPSIACGSELPLGSSRDLAASREELVS